MDHESAAEAQRDACLAVHFAAKDALQKRLAYVAEHLAPECKGTRADAAALIVTLQLIGEEEKLNRDAIEPAVTALADQLMAEALESDDLRSIAGNAAYQRGLAHMFNAYDIETNTNDAEQVAIAQHFVNAALQVGPQKAFYLSTLSQLAMEIGESESAYAYADAALREDPSNGEALRLKGNAAWALGRNDEAESLLIDALRVAPYLEQTREVLAMILTERADRDGLDVAELLEAHGVAPIPLTLEEVDQRIKAFSGPSNPDQLLYDSIIAHDMAVRLTPDKHVLIGFEVEKRGLFSGKGRLRGYGICSDGSPFFLMSAKDWTTFGGFMGTQLFTQLAVPPPQSGSRTAEDVLDAAIDFMVMMRNRLS